VAREALNAARHKYAPELTCAGGIFVGHWGIVAQVPRGHVVVGSLSLPFVRGVDTSKRGRWWPCKIADMLSGAGFGGLDFTTGAHMCVRAGTIPKSASPIALTHATAQGIPHRKTKKLLE
jgi:hypothetical protein